MNSSTAADEIEQLHLAVFVSLDPDTERHHISLANGPCFVTPCGANVGGNRCDVGVGELTSPRRHRGPSSLDRSDDLGRIVRNHMRIAGKRRDVGLASTVSPMAEHALRGIDSGPDS
jgi:hypothetical protein